MAELEFKDFTGGLNENYNTARPNQYAKADNILLNREGNPITRPGSTLFDVANSRLPTGNQRVGTIINYNRDQALFCHSGNRLFQYNAGWTEILGPSGGPALPTLSANAKLSFSEWKKHVLISSDEQIPPLKLYPDANGNFQIRTAGLPLLPTTQNFVTTTIQTQAIALANALRTAMIAHFADTGMHLQADTIASALITAPAATNLVTLLTLTGQLLKAYDRHFNDYTGVSQFHYKEVIDQTLAPAASKEDQQLLSVIAPNKLEDAAARLNDLKQRFNTHDGADAIHTHFHPIPNYQVLSTPFIDDATSGPSAQLDIAYIFAFANQIKARYNAHIADGGTATTPHSTAADHINTVTSPDANTWETLEALIYEIRYRYTAHDSDAQSTSGWVFHVGKENPSHALTPQLFSTYNNAPYPDLFAGLRAKNVSEIVAMLNTLAQTINAHISDFAAHYSTNTTAYVPHLIASGTVTLSSYEYAFVPLYTYYIGAVEFQTRGTPIYMLASDVISIQNQSLQISNIPSVANSSNTNYDTTNIQIEIYRSQDGQTQMYLVDTIANGTTSYTDGTTDAELIGSPLIYTASGESDNDAPPMAKFVHIVNDTPYYGNLKFPDGTSYPNRIQQAKSGTLDACPGDYFVDLPYENVGISSYRGVPIAWTKSTQYRIEGSMDSVGRGSIRAVGITDSVGMDASFSPIQTDEGVIFAGSDGFYLTDGYKQQKLSRDWLKTYLNLISSTSKASAIHGTLDRKNQRVWWVCNEASSDNDKAYILDLNFPLNENSVFTSASGGASFSPTAIGYFSGQIIRGDSRGYVFAHSESVKNDPKVDTSVSASLWGKSAIIYNLTTAATDFGTSLIKKWVAMVFLKAKNLGNLSLQINGINDDGSTHSCTPIRSRAPTGLINEKRHFPAGYMRCFSKQLQITNALVVITNSDTLGLATVDPVGKTVTLTSGIWPAYLNDQFLTLAGDGYTQQFTILSQSGAAITVSDLGNNLPAAGSYKWEIKGYAKDEQLQLLSITVPYQPMGPSQTSATTETGANT